MGAVWAFALTNWGYLPMRVTRKLSDRTIKVPETPR